MYNRLIVSNVFERICIYVHSFHEKTLHSCKFGCSYSSKCCPCPGIALYLARTDETISSSMLSFPLASREVEEDA